MGNTDVKTYWSDSKTVIAVAAATAFTGMLISLYGIKKHAEHYNAPRAQKYIVRIIFVVPVFAGMFSFLKFEESVLLLYCPSLIICDVV